LFGDDEARTAILEVRQHLDAMQAASQANEQRLMLYL
jgi:hypothetical protein